MENKIPDWCKSKHITSIELTPQKVKEHWWRRLLSVFYKRKRTLFEDIEIKLKDKSG